MPVQLVVQCSHWRHYMNYFHLLSHQTEYLPNVDGIYSFYDCLQETSLIDDQESESFFHYLHQSYNLLDSRPQLLMVGDLVIYWH